MSGMLSGKSEHEGVRVLSYTVGGLGLGLSVLAAYDDPNGYLQSFRKDPRLIIENPHAKKDDPALILALDGQKVVGRLGLFAGELFYGGQNIRVYWLSEFAMEESYKATGVGGMILLRLLALRMPLLACGAPSAELEKLYDRVGFIRLGPLRRFVRFYDTEVVARHFVGNKILARGLSVVVNLAFATFYSMKSRVRNHALTYRPIQSFDNSICTLFSYEGRNHCVRDPLTLNWVLKHNPAQAFLIYDGATLLGYCVLKIMKFGGGGARNLPEMNMGTLLDYYVADSSRKVLCDLLRFCVSRFEGECLDICEFQVCDEKLSDLCKEFGFIKAGGYRIFFKPGLGMTSHEARDWFLTLGTADAILMGS